MEDNSLINKKDLELNYLMLDMFHDRTLRCCLIHVKKYTPFLLHERKGRIQPNIQSKV